MECERLQRLVKSWFIQVQDESMAPARMVSFMKSHLVDCAICQADPTVRLEVDKIAAIVLPILKNRKGADEDKDLEKEELVAPSHEVEEELTVYDSEEMGLVDDEEAVEDDFVGEAEEPEDEEDEGY